MLSNLLKLTLALGVNFVLFIIIPVLNSLFNQGLNTGNDVIPQRVVAEIIQTKEKEVKPRRKQLREVTPQQGRRDVATMQMRFTPDLAIGDGEGVMIAKQNLEVVIFREGETDEDPIPISILPIPYPAQAKERDIQGVLLVEIVIGIKGQVEFVEVLKSPHPSISAEARKTIMQWKFKPAKNKGIPVRLRARKEIEFQLQ